MYHRKLFTLFCTILFLFFCYLQPANNYSSVHASTDNPISENTLVYRSLDGGANWSSFAESGQGLRTDRVNKIVIDPTNSATSYLATRHGIFKSTDDGNTWQHRTIEGGNRNVTDLIIDSVNSNNLYVIADEEFFRSQDGGNTWEKRLLTYDLGHTAYGSGVQIFTPRCMAIDPVNPANVYVGAQWAEFIGIYKSTNGGDTFRYIQQNFAAFWSIKQINIDSKNPSTIYFQHYSDLHDNKIYKSVDGGEHLIKTIWTEDDAYISSFLLDPETPSTLYICEDGEVIRSLDGGITWTVLGRAGLEAIDNFSTIYGKNNVGLAKSVDGGITFTALNFNRKFISLGFDPNNPSVIYATTSVTAFFGPRIKSISVDGKNLVITASDVHEGATVWVGSDAQVTKVSFEQSLATLTAKKAYKRIRPGQTVAVRIIDGDGFVSDAVSFTRPQ